MDNTRAARQWNIAGSTTLLVTVAVLVGIGLGIGAYTFVYAQAYSYLSSDPKVCANCHMMRAEYDSWQKSSHHHVAVCNDCHLPRQFVAAYFMKALNGFNHAKAYTLQGFAEPITIKPLDARIVQDNCLACHRALVQDAAMARGREEELSCVHCHASAGHGERALVGGPI